VEEIAKSDGKLQWNSSTTTVIVNQPSPSGQPQREVQSRGDIGLRYANELGRLGRVYLILTGFLCLFAGVIGLIPNSDLLASAIWYSRLVIWPFPVFAFIANRSGCSIYGFPYSSTLEPHESHFKILSVGIVVLSVAGIWAAFRIKEKNRVAGSIWLTLIVLSFAAAIANIGADLAHWDTYPYSGGKMSSTSALYVFLSTSYLVAYAVACLARSGSVRAAAHSRLGFR